MIDLSIVVPIKDERDNLRPLHKRVSEALASHAWSYELIIVDDGSTDDSLAILTQLAKEDDRVKVISLNRNYGQTPATRAGIDYASGNVIITMDGDLQNDPEDIPVLMKKLDEGYDGVFGQRVNRKDGFILRKIPSWIANWIIRKVTKVEIRDMGCTIRALRREVALQLPLYGELHRFIPVLAQQTGAKLTQIGVRHHPRIAGKTKYNLSRTFRVVLDLITVKFLYSYLTRPMHAFGMTGLITMALGFFSFLATVWMKLQNSIDMTGNPLLLLSVMLFVVGIQFISMGLLGEMLARTYFESQQKNAYLVQRTLNLESQDTTRRAA